MFYIGRDNVMYWIAIVIAIAIAIATRRTTIQMGMGLNSKMYRKIIRFRPTTRENNRILLFLQSRFGSMIGMQESQDRFSGVEYCLFGSLTVMMGG